MRHWKSIYATALCAAAMLVTPLMAADANTYQVTGPVLEVTPTTIVVQKGKERWEIARDANTKVSGELKAGEKVTITYKMTAQQVEVKEARDKKAGKGK